MCLQFSVDNYLLQVQGSDKHMNWRHITIDRTTILVHVGRIILTK